MSAGSPCAPTQPPPTAVPVLEVVAAVLMRNASVLVAKRPEGKTNAGLWEFPGGKVEAGETHAEALSREIEEELGIAVNVGAHLVSCEHTYPFATVRLHAYFCEAKPFPQATAEAHEPRALEHAEIRFLAPENWKELPFAPANLPIVQALLSSLFLESKTQPVTAESHSHKGVGS